MGNIEAYSKEQIQHAIEMLADRINEDWYKYTTKCGYGHPLYVCILDGAVPFFTYLTQQLEPGYITYIKASSYGNTQVAGEGGKVEIDMHNFNVPGRVNRVLIIDDICDSGKTLEAVSEVLRGKFGNDIPIERCVMLLRSHNNNNPEYAAIQDDTDNFYAGYGLDDKGLMRNLPFIYVCGGEE